METKPWYESWLVWLGILNTAIAVTEVVQVYLENGDFSPSGISALVIGVLVVVRRVWFTDTEILK